MFLYPRKGVPRGPDPAFCFSLQSMVRGHQQPGQEPTCSPLKSVSMMAITPLMTCPKSSPWRGTAAAVLLLPLVARTCNPFFLKFWGINNPSLSQRIRQTSSSFNITIAILLMCCPHHQYYTRKTFCQHGTKAFLPQKAPSFDTLWCFPFSLQTTWDAVLLFPCRYEDLLIARILIIITSKISTVGSILQETCAKQINPRQKKKLPIDTENKSSFQVSITITKIMEFQRKKKSLKHKS